jgi:hypothetical protein
MEYKKAKRQPSVRHRPNPSCAFIRCQKRPADYSSVTELTCFSSHASITRDLKASENSLQSLPARSCCPSGYWTAQEQIGRPLTFVHAARRSTKQESRAAEGYPHQPSQTLRKTWRGDLRPPCSPVFKAQIDRTVAAFDLRIIPAHKKRRGR